MANGTVKVSQVDVLTTSGTGTISIVPPATNTDRTLTLPDQTATVATLTTPSFGTTIGVGGATASSSGAGVTFPATQSASTDANTLDDYEEGTWTPTVEGGATAGTYTPSNVRAYYVKVGSQVTLWASFGFSAASGGSSYIKIGGAPFSYKASSALAGACGAQSLNTAASSSNGLWIGAQTSASSTYFTLELSNDNAALEDIAVTGISTSTSLYFSITYTVS